MKEPTYPLEQLLEVKLDRVNKAEKVVLEKKKAYDAEKAKLRKVEEERDKVKGHYEDKMNQMRQALDEGTTSPELLQMRTYLKLVKEDLVKEEAKVKKQQDQVAIAEKNLEVAKEELRKKRVEWEKIKAHKEEWDKEVKREMKKEEAKEMDEIGNILYEGTRKKRKEGE